MRNRPISLTRAAAGYPELVGELHDPPEQLRVRGADPRVLSRPSVAVVGARVCSPYAREVAHAIGRSLASAGLVVVSGLAHGVDSAAHRGALEQGHPTVAVLGSGLDVVYPARNRPLADEIAVAGLVVSEYADGTPPAPWRFPARNRIIAALAVATVVVEAARGSGALITADFALELGRDVYAVPGEITSSRAAGTNDLIRNGATPVTSLPELLEDLGVEPAPTQCSSDVVSGLSPDEKRVLDALAKGPLTLDALGRQLGLSQAELAGHVTALELAGVAQEDDGAYRATLL